MTDSIDPRPWWLHAALPRPGYWLVSARLGARSWGPAVPAMIGWVHTTEEPGIPDNRMERSGFWAAFVAGEPVSPWSLQQATHTFGDRIYRTLWEITAAEYAFRLADAAWAKRHAPHEPVANPHKKLDLLQAPLPF